VPFAASSPGAGTGAPPCAHRAELLIDRVFDVGADAADEVAALVADLVGDRGAQASGVDRGELLGAAGDLGRAALEELARRPVGGREELVEPGLVEHDVDVVSHWRRP
jgi:hypothetical protein